MNIIYIEDDRGLWALAKHALKNIHTELTGANSLAEARELLLTQQFSLALVDYELPDGKGIELIKEISNSIPCIMLTGVGSEELAVSSMRQGARDYIVKDVEGRYLEILPLVIERVKHEVTLEEENKIKELELNEVRKQLQVVFDSAPDLMVISNEKGVILQISKSASETYGLNVDKYIGKKINTLIPEKDSEKILSLSSSTKASSISTKLANSFEMIANSQLLDGNFFLIVFRNQTERIKASAAIEREKAVTNENLRLKKMNKKLIKTTCQNNNNTIIGNSLVIHELLSTIKSVSETDATVLILGETGTGKELIADEIHRQSERRDDVIIKLNCASIPTDLIESELFGYEKGAFTGAHKTHSGRFLQANNGTLFLDEIGELDMKVQSKLLRVLQEGEIQPLGSQTTLTIDVRLITATNRDIKSMVDNGTFRADLYYRLNVVPIHAPSLRERKQDIPLLAYHFNQKYIERYNLDNRILEEHQFEELSNREWPGNVRELQNIIERFVVLGKLDTAETVSSYPVTSNPSKKKSLVTRKLSDIEKLHILDTLEEYNWIIAGKKGAAQAIGLNPSTLRFRMKKLGISRETHQTGSTGEYKE